MTSQGGSQLIDVFLEGGSPFGLRLEGGDEGSIRVCKLHRRSKASVFGVLVGDELVAINNFNCNGMRLETAENLLDSVGENSVLMLRILRSNSNAASGCTEDGHVQNRTSVYQSELSEFSSAYPSNQSPPYSRHDVTISTRQQHQQQPLSSRTNPSFRSSPNLTNLTPTMKLVTHDSYENDVASTMSSWSRDVLAPRDVTATMTTSAAGNFRKPFSHALQDNFLSHQIDETFEDIYRNADGYQTDEYQDHGVTGKLNRPGSGKSHAGKSPLPWLQEKAVESSGCVRETGTLPWLRSEGSNCNASYRPPMINIIESPTEVDNRWNADTFKSSTAATELPFDDVHEVVIWCSKPILDEPSTYSSASTTTQPGGRPRPVTALPWLRTEAENKKENLEPINNSQFTGSTSSTVPWTAGGIEKQIWRPSQVSAPSKPLEQANLSNGPALNDWGGENKREGKELNEDSEVEMRFDNNRSSGSHGHHPPAPPPRRGRREHEISINASSRDQPSSSNEFLKINEPSKSVEGEHQVSDGRLETTNQSWTQQRSSHSLTTPVAVEVEERTPSPAPLFLRRIITVGPGNEADIGPNSTANFYVKTKKHFGDSSFYEDPEHKYPTIEEQIKMARKVAQLLTSPSNRNARGHQMFIRRQEQSSKWTVDMAELLAREARQAQEMRGQRQRPASCLPTVGREREHPSSAEELERLRLNQDKSRHDAVPFDLCARLAGELRSSGGKAAQMFARRRDAADNLPVPLQGSRSSHPSRPMSAIALNVDSFNRSRQFGSESTLNRQHPLPRLPPPQSVTAPMQTIPQEAPISSDNDSLSAPPVNRLKTMLDPPKPKMTPWDSMISYGHVEKAFEHLRDYRPYEHDLDNDEHEHVSANDVINERNQVKLAPITTGGEYRGSGSQNRQDGSVSGQWSAPQHVTDMYNVNKSGSTPYSYGGTTGQSAPWRQEPTVGTSPATQGHRRWSSVPHSVQPTLPEMEGSRPWLGAGPGRITRGETAGVKEYIDDSYIHSQHASRDTNQQQLMPRWQQQRQQLQQQQLMPAWQQQQTQQSMNGFQQMYQQSQQQETQLWPHEHQQSLQRQQDFVRSTKYLQGQLPQQQTTQQSDAFLHHRKPQDEYHHQGNLQPMQQHQHQLFYFQQRPDQQRQTQTEFSQHSTGRVQCSTTF